MYAYSVSDCLRCLPASVGVYKMFPDQDVRASFWSAELICGRRRRNVSMMDATNIDTFRWRNISLNKYLCVFCPFHWYSWCVPTYMQPKSACYLRLTLLSVCVSPFVVPQFGGNQTLTNNDWRCTSVRQTPTEAQRASIENQWLLAVLMSTCSGACVWFQLDNLTRCHNEIEVVD